MLVYTVDIELFEGESLCDWWLLRKKIWIFGVVSYVSCELYPSNKFCLSVRLSVCLSVLWLDKSLCHTQWYLAPKYVHYHSCYIHFLVFVHNTGQGFSVSSLLLTWLPVHVSLFSAHVCIPISCNNNTYCVCKASYAIVYTKYLHTIPKWVCLLVIANQVRCRG